MEMNFDNANFQHIQGTPESDRVNAIQTFFATFNTTQGGYDLVTVDLAKATNFIFNSGVLSLSEGHDNNLAVTGNFATAHLGNSHNTNIFSNMQDGGFLHITANDFSTNKIYLPDDKSCTGTWSGENLNTLTLTVTAPTDNPIPSQITCYGVSDGNIPQIFGANVYICSRPQGETTEELEEVPSLDEVIQPPSDSVSDQSQSTFPLWIEPIEHATGSKLVTTTPVTDTPKVNPTSTM